MDFLKRKIFYLKLLCVLLSLFSGTCHFKVYAQCDDKNGPNDLSWDFDQEKNKGFSIITTASDAVTPQIIIDAKSIRAYVRDERFQIMRSRCGDMRAIDAIYLKSLRITEYNIARALFVSFLAVLEHRNVYVKVPIIKSLELPVSFEEDSLFYARLKNLPRRVYPDTPADSVGDVDKLQHFFGSAYLAYSSESPGLAHAAGNLIEWTEDKFVVGGVDDPRDKRANNQGKSFGRDLLVVKTLLPSDYLTFVMEGRK
jgi:hypothetical protein